MAGIGTFLYGVAYTMWHLVAFVFLSTNAPPAQRGKTMSGMGLTYRIGGILGPLIGGGIATLVNLRVAVAAGVVIALLAAAISVLSLPRPEGMLNDASGEVSTVEIAAESPAEEEAPASTKPWTILYLHRWIFFTVGGYTLLL
jgi:MFS family permease